MEQSSVSNRSEIQQGQAGAQCMNDSDTAGYPILLQQYLVQHQREQQLAAIQQQNAAQLAMAGFSSNNNATTATNFASLDANTAHAFGALMPGWGGNGMMATTTNNNLLQQQQANLSGVATPRDEFAEQGILGPWSERSAGLLGKMVAQDPSAVPQTKVKRTRRKQPKDKPKRPLSAYNIFFREERARLLEEKEKVKNEHSGDPTASGKIGFESLAKIIGGKWQALSPTEVEQYKEKAAEDMGRYRKAMEDFNQKQASKNTKESDKVNDVEELERESKRPKKE